MKVEEILESAMPPQDAKNWLEDLMHDAVEAGTIKEAPTVTWKMVDDFVEMLDKKLPEYKADKMLEQEVDDIVFDIAMEVYHQHVGPVGRDK